MNTTLALTETLAESRRLIATLEQLRGRFRSSPTSCWPRTSPGR
ncbi:hypothetical protein [Kouleothrix sp.]